MKLPIPVNLILGQYGAGKTSFLNYLLRHKASCDTYADEKWAIIINERGEVPLEEPSSSGAPGGAPFDGFGGAGISGAGNGGEVSVREIGGGCVCCSLSGVLSASIAQVSATGTRLQ